MAFGGGSFADKGYNEFICYIVHHIYKQDLFDIIPDLAIQHSVASDITIYSAALDLNFRKRPTILIVHIYGVQYPVNVFQCIYTLYNDQIGVISISITSNTCHFFAVGTLNVLFSSYFEICMQEISRKL